jgi:hypothetical protein
MLGTLGTANISQRKQISKGAETYGTPAGTRLERLKRTVGITEAEILT